MLCENRTWSLPPECGHSGRSERSINSVELHLKSYIWALKDWSNWVDSTSALMIARVCQQLSKSIGCYQSQVVAFFFSTMRLFMTCPIFHNFNFKNPIVYKSQTLITLSQISNWSHIFFTNWNWNSHPTGADSGSCFPKEMTSIKTKIRAYTHETSKMLLSYWNLNSFPTIYFSDQLTVHMFAVLSEFQTSSATLKTSKSINFSATKDCGPFYSWGKHNEMQNVWMFKSVIVFSTLQTQNLQSWTAQRFYIYGLLHKNPGRNKLPYLF